MKPRLIHELLFATAEKYPNRPAYWLRKEDAVVPFTYRELAARVRSVASGLVELGVTPQARVGMYASSSPEWGITYLSILAAGGVVVPLDPQLKYLELRTIITTAGMSYLFCEEGSYADLLELKAIAAPYPEIIIIDAPARDSDSTELTLQQIEVLGNGKEFSELQIASESLAILIFTSGTSGDSKGVMLSHDNIIYDIEAILPRLGIGPDDRFLSVLPLHHTFEATCGLIFPLSIGASISYARTLRSADLMADINAVQATVMCGVPLLFEKMYIGMQRALAKKTFAARLYVDLGQRIAGLSKSIFDLATGRLIFKSLRSRAGLDSIRMFVSGGAAINPEISRFFNNLGIVLLQGYGLTETSPVLSVNTERDNNYASVGRPLDGVETKILDANERGIGEIAVKGKMVMMGYYNDSEATETVMKDGYFRTGDLGFIDEQGHLHITGRKKNVIITPAGKNIYPEEIETLLECSPLIVECAVVPRKRGSGEEPVAVVVPDFEYIASTRDDGKAPDDEVRKIIKDEVVRICNQLAEFKRIKDVIVMTEELPKTSTKKIKRFVLIDSLQQLGEL